MALDGAGRVPEFAQLDVAQFVDDASGFLAENHIVSWFSQIFPNRLIRKSSVAQSPSWRRHSPRVRTGDAGSQTSAANLTDGGGFLCGGALMLKTIKFHLYPWRELCRRIPLGHLLLYFSSLFPLWCGVSTPLLLATSCFLFAQKFFPLPFT